jgi:ribosome-associated protein
LRQQSRGDTIPRVTPKTRRKALPAQSLLDRVERVLQDGKAEDLVIIDLQGKTTIADHMLIATGRSARQVTALAERVIGVLIDAGDVIVHLFRPEVRRFYNLEKMWGTDLPEAAEPTD